jgi:hypothetical protein
LVPFSIILPLRLMPDLTLGCVGFWPKEAKVLSSTRIIRQIDLRFIDVSYKFQQSKRMKLEKF